MVDKQTAEQLMKIKQGGEREQALKAILSMNTRDALIDYARRLKRPPYLHLSDLADVCIDRCIDEGFLHGNYVKLPEPLPQDTERVDLHRMWLKAIAITNKCSLPTINSVKNRGYLNAMLKQIDKIEDIGTGGFDRLNNDGVPEYSAEYLMRKYFSDLLREDQIEKIDKLLNDNGIRLS